jgi:large subunit ribosomal protein L28
MYAAPVAWNPFQDTPKDSRCEPLSRRSRHGVGTVSASEVFGVTPVAANCDVCGKGPGFGNNISFSHRRTRRRWNPNIQTVRAVIGRTPKRLNVCTSCIKAGKVSR